jgi:hypothetical protein
MNRSSMSRKEESAVRRAIMIVGVALLTCLGSSPARAAAAAPGEAAELPADPLQEILDAARHRVEELVAHRDALQEGEERAAMDAEIVRVKRDGAIDLLRRRLELHPDDEAAAAVLARLLGPAPAPPVSGTVERKPVPGSVR